MNPGLLRHPFRLERKVTGQDEAGRAEPVWLPVVETMAAIQPLRGSEYFLAEREGSDTTHKVTIRAVPGVRVQPHEHRVVVTDPAGERVFEVQSALDLEERGAWLTLMCREEAAA